MADVSLTERALLRETQAQQMAQLARTLEQRDKERVKAAYRRLAGNVDFQVLRTYWVSRYCLTPHHSGDCGDYNFVVKMLAEMREAGAPEMLGEVEG